MGREIIFLRLLSLIKRALKDDPVDDRLFAGMDHAAWNELYQMAVQQGVMSVAFDGIRSLPAICQYPVLLQRIQWGLSVEKVEQQYIHKRQVAADIASIFDKQNIRMLVFKGFSLAENYPVPAHREFGDIDIYLFGQLETGDRLLLEAGAERENQKYSDEAYKHSSFYYHRTVIENHAFFLTVRDSRKIRILNRTLLDILERDNSRLTQSQCYSGQILFPPPDFTALFFMAHAIHHLTTHHSSVLRTYCDWAMFLKVSTNKWNVETWKKNLEEAGLLEIAEAITSLTVQWFDIPSEIAPQVESHPKLEEAIRTSLLRLPYPPCQAKTPWGIIGYKFKHFMDKYNYSRQFTKVNLPATIIDSIGWHIRHPKTIFGLVR